MPDYQNKSWFQFLDHSMQDLASISYILLEIFSAKEYARSYEFAPTSSVSAAPPFGGSGRNGHEMRRCAVKQIPATSTYSQEIHDFSFIVFPLAKAYEGFLKKWLFANHFISDFDFRSDHFRLGKALNPSLEHKFRGQDYVYDKIVANCPDPHLADRLWDAWKECRNLIFHYFPNHQHFLENLPAVQNRIDQLDSVMTDAMENMVKEEKGTPWQRIVAANS